MNKQEKPVSNHIWKVGDTARIVGNRNSHQFEIGEIVRLVEPAGVDWKAKRLDGRVFWFVDECDIEPLEQVKPRICEVLGAEVGERFKYPGMIREFYITENGTLVAVGDDGQETYNTCISTLINRYDHIIRPPRFTEDEVAAMRVLYAAGIRTVERDKYTTLWMGDDGRAKSTALPYGMLPSIRAGQSVVLGDVVAT